MPGARDELLAYARELPGAWVDRPWGDEVVKVGKKIFVFLGENASVKLASSHEAALAVPGAFPTRYGLGRAGWVSVPLAAGTPVEVLRDWVEESYRRIAPRTLVAELDLRAAG